MKKKLKTIKAAYVSVWDGGTEVRTACNYNPETKDVTNIGQADVEGLDLAVLDREYVELPDGTDVEDYTIEGEKRGEDRPLNDEDIAFLQRVVGQHFDTPDQN